MTDQPTREQPEECDCCRFQTSTLKAYRPNVMARSKDTRWLCALCAGTMTSTFDDYPTQHDGDQLQIMKTICYVGNAILQALSENTR